jgi:hypothetical protein
MKAILKKYKSITKYPMGKIETSIGIREGFDIPGVKVFYDEDSLCMLAEDFTGEIGEISFQEFKDLIR